MSKDQPEIARKLRILQHADETVHVASTRRYSGVGRSSFYRWREAYQKHGDANRTPSQIEESPASSQQVPPRPNADRLSMTVESGPCVFA